jgi:poly-gamma-glutamate capsule biosynthesis protein CapA/YwtB (metallophosphatase superfamily)
MKNYWLWPSFLFVLGGTLLALDKWADTRPIDDLLSPPAPITMVVAGDVSMGRQTGQKILRGEVDYPFSKLNGYLAEPDITFVNLESQLADLGGETDDPNSDYRFAGPPEGAKSLADAGVDIVSLANNHMWDYGEARLEETFSNLENAGVRYVGATPDKSERCSGNYFEINGKKIYFFAITTLINGYEKAGANERICYVNELDSMLEDIKTTRALADWIFVSFHTGVEYSQKPTQQMIDMSHKLIDVGADAVLGHHPHVIQPIEIYNGKPIFYSFGNFAFWQPFSFWTQHSYLARFTLDTPHQIKYEIVPVKAGWQPEIETETSAIQQITDFLTSNLAANT